MGKSHLRLAFVVAAAWAACKNERVAPPRTSAPQGSESAHLAERSADPRSTVIGRDATLSSAPAVQAFGAVLRKLSADDPDALADATSAYRQHLIGQTDDEKDQALDLLLGFHALAANAAAALHRRWAPGDVPAVEREALMRAGLRPTFDPRTMELDYRFLRELQDVLTPGAQAWIRLQRFDDGPTYHLSAAGAARQLLEVEEWLHTFPRHRLGYRVHRLRDALQPSLANVHELFRPTKRVSDADIRAWESLIRAYPDSSSGKKAAAILAIFRRHGLRVTEQAMTELVAAGLD